MHFLGDGSNEQLQPKKMTNFDGFRREAANFHTPRPRVPFHKKIPRIGGPER